MNTMTLTNLSTMEIQLGEYAVSVELLINDGEEDILSKTIFFHYDTNTTSLPDAKAEFLQKVKDEWDKFERISADSNLDEVDSALVEVQVAAESYINS